MHRCDRPSAVRRLHPRPAGREERIPGLVPVRAPQGELTQVLFSAAAAPAQQGLLYIAMFDAGWPGRTPTWPGRRPPEAAKTRVGEVLYAIDPEAAPEWPAKRSGIVEVWAGSAMACAAPART